MAMRVLVMFNGAVVGEALPCGGQRHFTFYGLSSGAGGRAAGRLAPAVPRCQSRKEGGNMGDGIGTSGAVCWLDRLESALYERLFSAVCAGDTVSVDKWLNCLERLGII